MKSVRLARALAWATPDAEVPLLTRLGAVLASFAIASVVTFGVAAASASFPLSARVGVCVFCFVLLQIAIHGRIVGESLTRTRLLFTVGNASVIAVTMAWLVNFASKHY